MSLAQLLIREAISNKRFEREVKKFKNISLKVSGVIVLLLLTISGGRTSKIVYMTGFESDDFEYGSFQVGPINGQNNWTWTNPGVNIITGLAKDAVYDGRQALRLGPPNSVRGAILQLTPVEGIVTIEQWIKPGEYKEHGGMIYYFGSSGDVTAHIVLAADGYVRVIDGNHMASIRSNYTWKVGEWLRLTIILDHNCCRYDLLVNGKPAITNANFRNQAHALQKIIYYGSDDGGSDYCVMVDNLKIFTCRPWW
jgi:hypothetical protein